MADSGKGSPKKEKKRPSAVEETLLLKLVQYYFKVAGGVLFVWLFGYFEFSPSWLLIALVIFVWRVKYSKVKENQIATAQHLARDEQGAILARMDDLPSWVIFPDVERAEWVNKYISQLWPYVGDYVTDLLRTTIEPKIRESLPSSLSSFKFTKIDLGDIPPRIGGIKVYTEHVKRDEIVMDMEIVYSSDADVAVKMKGIEAGIKDLQVRGTMRVVFKPLISIIPLFGGLSVFFLNNPRIDFNLTSLANAFDVPGLSDMLRTIVQEQIAAIMVLPNRISISMVQGIDLNKLRYPPPQGVVRIHVLEARDLKKADLSILGQGKSDPYAVVKIGAQKFKTKAINNTVTPKWNQVFEAIIDERSGQYLEMDVMDEDPGSKDDFLGSLSLELSTVASAGLLDTWIPLEGVKKGLVHLKIVWLNLVKDRLELDKIVQVQESQNDQTDSSSILMVNIDSARDLPRSKKNMAEPSPYAIVSSAQVKFETPVKPNTSDPRWEENYRFLIHNPHVQDLDVQVMDKKTGKSLGHTSVLLKSLLTAPDMTLDQRFDLKGAGIASQIQMRLCLRVLTTEVNPEWAEETENIHTAPTTEGDATDAETSQHPSKASPDDSITSKNCSLDDSSFINGTDMIIPSVSQDTQAVRQRKMTNSGGTESRGEIQITIRYSSQRQRLIVVVHKCTNLIPCDSDNLADPYVRLYLLPDKSSGGKRKTQMVKNNLNPVFDETFEFQVIPTDLSSRVLDIVIKNHVSMFSSGRSLMGTVQIDLSNLDISKAITDWFELQPEESKNSKVSLESDV